MPESSPAFFQSDKRPRWRSALIGCWLWIRLKFHQSPGFATATIAGTLGLALCLFMLLNGDGAPWFGGRTVADEELDSSELDANLGEADDDGAATGFVAVKDGVDYEGLVASSKTALNSPATQKETVPEENPFDNEPFARPVIEKRPVRRNPLLEEPAATETPADEPELEITPSARPARIAITPPEVVVDEPALSGNEPEPDDNATFLTRVRPMRDDVEEAMPDDAKAETDDEVVPLVVDRKPAKRDASSRFLLDDEPKAEERIEPVSTEVAEPASPNGPASVADSDSLVPIEPAEKPAPVSEEPVATDENDIVPRSPPGWKNAPQTPTRRRSAPPMPWAEQSDEVQTTIHAEPAPAAVPEAPERSAIEPAAAQMRAAPAAVRIEIRAPSRMVAGRSYELEIVVINLAESAVNDALLSVSLPARLQHSLGAEVERPLGVLRARELRRARLTVQAVAEGPFVLQAEVAARGRVAAKLSTTIGSRTTAATLSRGADDCYCAPVR